MPDQSQILKDLYSSIKDISDISEENWEMLTTCSIIADVPKGGFLLKTGDICNAVFFVYKGYCRAFQENEGKEVNLNFFFENEFITNIKSFTKKERSEFSIQACENMVVVKIEKNKLIEHAYNNSQEFEIFGRKMLELMIMKQDAHVNLFKLYTPRQRYEFIEKTRPEIIRRVALTQIASYLGVTRETLTRIRKKKIAKI